MDISRRTFLKASVTGGLAVSALGFDLRPAQAAVRQLKIRNATEYRTVCPYCAVGCGTIAREARHLDPGQVAGSGRTVHPATARSEATSGPAGNHPLGVEEAGGELLVVAGRGAS